MKNRIMRKIAAAGMAVFLVGMSAGSGYMWKDAPVYAADMAEISDEEENSNLSEILDMDTIIAGTEFSDMNVDMDIIPNESDLLDNEQSLTESEDSEESLKEDSEEASDESLPTDEDANPFSDGDNEEKTALQADLNLSVQAENDTVKAGSDLVYTITAENTGECDLKDIRISYNFSENGLSGEWSEGAEDAVGNTAYIEKLEASATKILYLTVHLPEDRANAVSLKLTATAGKVLGENETGEAEEIVKNAELVTQIQALQAAFEVTKTADRSMAVPGDEIRFLICIRNTGERTLHSVVTTERFQLGNVPVRFLEKEGVKLNKAKTKAKIEQIAPGEAFGLEAVVTLPESLKDQNLVNEVSVTTLETGEQTKIAQSEIQVKAAEEEKQEETTSDIDEETGSEQDESRPASTHPKTGDPYQPLLWLFMIPGSLLAVGWLRSRM